MSEFLIGQKVYCAEPCEGLEFGRAYTVADVCGLCVLIDGHGSGYKWRFSPIDPLVPGSDGTVLDRAFWKHNNHMIERVKGRLSYAAIGIDGGVVLSTKEYEGRDLHVTLPEIKTLGQLRRLVAAVLGEG